MSKKPPRKILAKFLQATDRSVSQTEEKQRVKFRMVCAEIEGSAADVLMLTHCIFGEN